LASISFSVLHELHFIFCKFIGIILVDSINIITVIDDSIVTKMGHKIINIQAIVFHIIVIGIISQYHVVDIVTMAHQNVFGIEIKLLLFQNVCSAR
jgi:hypothetical protein